MLVLALCLVLFCAGKKGEQRLKQTAEDVDKVEDDTAEAGSSDPMMGFAFNECKLVCVRESYRSTLWLRSLHVDTIIM